MLQRFTQVGEYYVMSKPDGLDDEAIGFMDIMLYDEESDKFVKIPYIDALASTGVFTITDRAAGTIDVAAAGDPDQATVIGKKADGTDLLFGAAAAQGTYAANAIALAALNAVKSGTAGTVGKALDAPVILSRPFIEHAMLSAVLTVSGQDTGATLFGPSDMQISVRFLLPCIQRAVSHWRASSP